MFLPKPSLPNLVAVDVPALIAAMDGRKIYVLEQDKLLKTKGAVVNDARPDWRTRLLSAITNPSVALLLMTIGIYGLFFEFMNPGTGVPGVVGAISPLLALYALQLLPVNYAGLALIVLGMAFMVAEAFLPSFGVFGLGGIAAFVTGALILIDTELPGFGIPVALVVSIALVSAILPGLELVLHADALALLFVSLSAALWFFTTLYAIGYLEGSPHRSRFFGFFSLCVTAMVGVAMAGNLFTFFFFYELLTLSTYPLVVHRGTESTLRAGNVYLAYTLAGGAVLLTGVVWMYGLLGRVEFIPGGSASALGPAYAEQLRLVFVLLIAGVGVKAALVPLS